MTFKEPMIIVQFKSQSDLKFAPQIYIKTFEEAIKVNADNKEVLEEVKRRLISLRSEVDDNLYKIHLKQQDFKVRNNND